MGRHLNRSPHIMKAVEEGDQIVPRSLTGVIACCGSLKRDTVSNASLCRCLARTMDRWGMVIIAKEVRTRESLRQLNGAGTVTTSYVCHGRTCFQFGTHSA